MRKKNLKCLSIWENKFTFYDNFNYFNYQLQMKHRLKYRYSLYLFKKCLLEDRIFAKYSKHVSYSLCKTPAKKPYTVAVWSNFHHQDIKMDQTRNTMILSSTHIATSTTNPQFSCLIFNYSILPLIGTKEKMVLLAKVPLTQVPKQQVLCIFGFYFTFESYLSPQFSVK